MKIPKLPIKTKLLGFAVLISVLHAPLSAFGQPSAFTYQGRFLDNLTPANGTYDFRFTLHNDSVLGSTVGGSLTNSSVAVNAGLFNATLDFGVNAFPGAARWLQIGVRTNGGADFATLWPRQPVTTVPYSLQAASAGTVQTGGVSQAALQEGSVNSVKILDGTIVNADISPAAAIADSKLGTISTAGKVANAATTATSANTANAIVMRDGAGNFTASTISATAFSGNGAALTGLNAGALVSGTVADARLSANLPRLNLANTFTAAQNISVGGVNVATFASSAAGGSWLNLRNTGAGGRPWDFISTGPGNGEGAGKLLVRDQTASAVRMTFDTDGDVGIGTTSPGSKLEVAGPDATIRLRNLNDIGGGVLLNSYSTLQLGLFNPAASAWGVVPANGRRSMFGLDSAGRVGSLTNTNLIPVFRNVLDDGTGNASFSGNVNVGPITLNANGIISANSLSASSINASAVIAGGVAADSIYAPNVPAFAYFEGGATVVLLFGNQNLNANLLDLTIQVPAAGVLHLEASMNAFIERSASPPANIDMELKLDEYTVAGNYVTTLKKLQFYNRSYDTPTVRASQQVSGAGSKRYRLVLYKTSGIGSGVFANHFIKAWFHPLPLEIANNQP